MDPGPAEPANASPTGGPTPAARRSLRQRPWFRLLVFGTVLYVAWCTTLYLYQDRLLFPADLAPAPLPLKFDVRTIELTRRIGADRPAVAWFIPARGASAESPAPLAVYFHGNAEIIDYMDFAVQGYLRLGCSVLLPEYRGYGRSGGEPSEAGIVEDAAHFLNEAARRPDVDAARIVLHGRSLGGGPAAGVAARRTPRALILESTFTSAAAMAHRYAAPAFLARNPFHVDRVVLRLDIPMLILHGTHDDIIPVSHGRRLSGLASNGTYVEFDCAHNDFPGDGNEDAYWNAVRDFLAAADVIEAPAP